VTERCPDRITVAPAANCSSRFALSRRAPFTFLDDRLAGSPGLAALGAHSAFSFSSHAETNTPDYDTDARRGAFLDDPATLRAWLLNDVVVRKGGRNDQKRKSGTGQPLPRRFQVPS
jgi:hypothetical protein